MSDVKISALPASTTPLAGTEVLPIVQGGTTKQVSIADVTAGRAASAASLSLGTVANAASTKLTLSGQAEAIRCVDDSVYVSFYNSTNTTRTGYMQFGAAIPTTISVDVAQPLIFATTSTERMRIDSSGNVGIAKTPNAPLDVNGSINSNQGIYSVGTPSDSATGIGVGAVFSVATGGAANVYKGFWWQLGAGNQTKLFMGNSSANSWINPLTIFTSGGVSIGNTTDPGASNLSVSGLIFPQQAASAPTYQKGAIYFDTTLNKLRVGGATGWETITSV